MSKSRLLVLLLVAFILIFSIVEVQAQRFEGYERETTYGEYLDEYDGQPRPDREINIPVENYSDTNMNLEVLEDFDGHSGKSLKTAEEISEEYEEQEDYSERPYVEWEIDIEEAGMYNIEFEYYPIPGRTGVVQRDLWINGERPFQESRYLEFSRVWGPAYDPLIDVNNNEIRPRQIEKPQWRSVNLYDSLGYILEPLQYYFEEGENTLRLYSLSEPLLIGNIKLHREEEPLDYAEKKEQYEEKNLEPVEDFGVEEGKIQGEDSPERSNSTLFSYYDRGDPTMEPYHPVEQRLNTIGGHRWNSAGQWISWDVEVPRSGLYQIAFKAKQDQQRGVLSHRKLRINGETPFAEASDLPFNFSSYYDMYLLGEEKQEDPYLFYLEEGVNEISLEVVLGDMAEIIRQVENELYNMNSIYRRIVMITSPNPDPLRDYQLEQRIPGIVEALGEQAEFFNDITDRMMDLTGKKGEQTQMLESVALLLTRMAERPHTIPDNLPQYRDNVGQLGTWLNQVTEQPLAVDYLVVSSPGTEMPSAKPDFFDVVSHESRAFVSSFTYNYEDIGDLDPETMQRLSEIRQEESIEDDILGEQLDSDAQEVDDLEEEVEQETEEQEEDIAEEVPEFDEDRKINVWIGMGRDQAQTLKQMIEDSFTPETGITVNLQLISNMGGLLIPATIAGTAPDVAIGAARIQLAFRGALHDLSEFDDFEEVAERFHPSAFTPFSFRDNVFALPEMQAFAMLFYREDILEELGLEVPRTWEDIYEVLPVLQRNNMNFGLQPNMGSMLMFLYQQGVPLFHPDMVKTNLDSETSIRTLQDMSDLYTLYDLPYEFRANNRFRMGEMPLVIMNYGFFQELQVFAPELRGEWDFTLIPGTRQPDGDGIIAHTNPVSGSGNPALVGSPSDPGQRSSTAQGLAGAATTGTVIMDSSDKKDDAWEFLKWWTNAESQSRFGQELESLMGAAARYATANQEGMQRLPWNPNQRDELLKQWEWVEGIPPVPGGYYVNRQFNWLFRAVVLQDEPVRESVQDYVRRADRELTRKRREFDFETEIEDIDERWIRQFWNNFQHLDRLELDQYKDLR
ncbi:MAG: extracellular solute-binding protein [Bacillota bacterium]